ncbi:MAG: amino acid adenylation domain-containing protein, partial [Candidatus Aminicenantes bacterium]
VIYTSGSTGKPKGVMVEHQSLANLCCWHNRRFSVTYKDRASKYAGIGFDASVWEIFPYIICGASLYIIEEQIKLDIPGLNQYFEKHHITISFLPTQVCEQFMTVDNPSLRILLTGGDKLKRFVKQNYCLVNNYGPTEDTVVATSCVAEQSYRDIPIGKPIFNNRIYILNRHGNLQPVGIPGELCIAGESLARGYLNRPGLTAEKFIKGTRGLAPLLYHSGDLAKWLPDGNIMFIGRIDHQVKIRGYRIELGEIENQLMNVNTIKEAVVLARENKPGEKYLCAYIVSDNPLQDSSLRQTLSQHLPDYMIPSYFVQLDKLPLTPNGKIDRKALPGPGVKTGQDEYQAPRDDVEEKLAKTWAEVLLGKSAPEEANPISINDNFFNIGGDSIKAIQVAARLKKFGLKLEIKDLFANPTIKQLRQTITPIKRTIDQGPVRGEVQLTPIQQWFFENNFAPWHHFNQAVMIYRQEGFDENIVRRVFQQLTRHHDALRMVYQFNRDPHQAEKPVVLQTIRDIDENTKGKLLHLELFDLKETGEDHIKKEIPQQANRIQSSINPETGPLLKLGLFKTAAGDHLLMVIHHLVVDGISWRILLEDFALGYQQAMNNEPLRFPPKTDSFKQWAHQLKKYAESPALLNELEYWKRIEKTSIPPLPGDFEISPAEKKIKNNETLRLTLDADQTRQLLKEVNHAYSTEINDILLAALGLAVKDWAGIDNVFIHLEGHGREEIIRDIDISRTVGWFTSQYPVLLEMSPARDLSHAIKHVKETLRRIPNKGIGYGILKYLTPADKKDGFAPGQNPGISFNYLGEFGSIGQDHQENIFRVSPMRTGNQFSPDLEQWYTININGIIAQSQLVLSFSYNKYQYKPDTIAGLLDSCKIHLLNIISHCVKKERQELTPSDLTYPHLSIDQLEAFTHQLGDIEDIYEITPMQAGMLFHALKDEESPAYVEQMVFSIKGNIDKNLLQKSFNLLVERYDILRTLFYYEQVDQPIQIVLKHRHSDIYFEEIKHLPPDTRDRYLKEFYLKDRQKGFDLSRDNLIRLLLLKTGENTYQVVLTFHHILMDGWCTGIIFNELAQIYNSMLTGEPIKLEPVSQYVDYIKWLKTRDKKEGLEYWQEYLAGYESLPGLTVPGYKKQEMLKDRDREIKYELEEYVFILEKSLTDSLMKIALKNNVTVNTVIQSIWGILLQKYNQTDDVVYGAVVSGRPPELEDVERMLGLFINTVPVRIQSHGKQTFSQLVHQVQQNAALAKSYEYLPLAEIQALSSPKEELINHIMAFENYPIDTLVKDENKSKNHEFKVEDVKTVEQTNYHFNMVISPGKRLLIKFIFNSLVYEKNFVKRISQHFTEIVNQVTANVHISKSEIEIIPEVEKQRVLYEFNEKHGEYPQDRTIPGLFARQVEQTPDHISVTGMDHGAWSMEKYLKGTRGLAPLYITYRELNKRSHQLALHLKEKGVKPDTIVGLMVERSIEMIVGILGILKAGGAYLPIDPKNPEERARYMLADCNVGVLLTTPKLKAKVKAEVEKNFKKTPQLPLDFVNIETGPASAFESPLSTLTSTCQVSPVNLAYIIYTSGSTGIPKGVPIRHANFSPLLHWGYRHLKIGPADRVIQILSYYFDWSVWEIFITLTTGASLFMITENTLLNPDLLVNFIIEKGISILHMTPTHYQYLMDVGKKQETLKYLFIGAEKLTVDLARRSIESVTEQCRVFNMYGPTEAAIISSVLEIRRSKLEEYKKLTSVPIGKPVGNIDLLVLDRFLKLCPIEVTGELYIAGDALAMGYMNDPARTRQSFIKNIFKHKGIKGEHLYKTGDLVRWLEHGTVEFLGRKDHQLKIRGIRIELGEIENRLMDHKNVKEAVVIAREEKGKDKYLCAYIVPHRMETFREKELRNHLAAELPYYMIPTYFVPLEKIPLNPNGKMDRNALPGPEIFARKNYTPPGNRIEKKLAAIWSEVLHWQGTIGIDDNFFDLGGHSLTVTTMASKIYKAFNVRIPLVEIFNTPFIRGLTEYIKKETGERIAAIEPTEKKEFYALSSAQKRLYILQQMESTHVGYNMPQIIPLEENIDIKRLELTFKKLITRHESLRTSFHMVKDEPIQEIHDQVEFKIDYFDFKTARVEVNVEEEEEQPAAALTRSFIHPFDLSQAPLLRVKVIKTRSPGVKLFVDMHHIITDGVSQNILKDELQALYAGEKLPTLKLQYKDYAQWQNNPNYQVSITAQEDYWSKIFSDELPVLTLPTDFPRSLKKSFEGSTTAFILTTTQTKQLKDLSKKANITLFMFVMAVFNVLLSNLGNQEDIIVGIPIMGRRHVDLERIIGMFVNTLALRNYPAGNKTFKEFLHEVRESTLAAFENQDYQFDELVKKLSLDRDTDRNPIFDVMFNLLNQFDYTDNILEMDKQRLHQHQKSVSKFDLTLTAVDLGENLLCSFEYSTKLFESRTIDRIIEYFKKIFDLIFQNPNQKLAEIEITTAAEKRQILYEFNDKDVHYSKDKTLHRLFEEQMEQTPDQIALVGPYELHELHEKGTRGLAPLSNLISITYSQLSQKSDQLAHLLIKTGVKPDTIVALMLERSIEMIIGIFGILKAGGAYLPIDLDYPAERINYMFTESNTKFLVTTPALSEKFKKLSIVNCQLLMVNEEPPGCPGFNIPPKEASPHLHLSPWVNAPATSLAYIIYTSGTTGKPKGTLTTHANVIRVVKNTNYIELTGNHRILQLSNYAFDGSVFDIYGALLNGAALVLVDQDRAFAVDQLAKLIKQQQITVFFVTTALFNILIDTQLHCFADIRKVLFGGERVSLEHSRKALQYMGKGKVIHVYGPTETTVFATYYFIDRIEKKESTIPIGMPISNTTAYILDRCCKLAPIGVTGELYIGGEGLARGYLNNPELTAEKFIKGTRGLAPLLYAPLLYRTGDLVRWLPDGAIEFLGRQDFQVKIRGFRIEPGEIENRLLNHPQVKEALVIARQQQGKETKEKYLCAYIVADRDQNPKPSDLRDYLAVQFPPYMVPAYFVLLEQIPLNPNGKVDRNTLPEPEFTADEDYASPTNPVEQQLTEIWAELLGVRGAIGIDDNFFELGGHSLKAAVLAAKIHQAFQVKIPLKEIFSTPTIKELADSIARANKNPYKDIEKLKESDFYEPSYHQKRLWVLHQLSPASPAFHMPGNLVLNHEVDEQAIKKTVYDIVQRHESFRTGFKLLNDQPMQFILSEIEPPLQMIDISAMKENEKHQELDRIYKEIALKPFQLDRPPLFRSVLVKSGPRHYEFMFNMHHIISDGWSMEILKRDFSQIYEGYRKGKEVKLLPLSIQYKDFAAMHNQQLKDPVLKNKAHAFWKKKLQEGIPKLNFHGSLNKHTNDKKGAGYQCAIDNQLKEKLKNVAKQKNTSLFMVMFSVYILFLARFTGEQDIACSFISAGREHITLHNIIGFFVNSVIFRTRVDYRQSFEEFLQQVNKDILEIFAYQSYPLELLFEELQMRYPDIPVSFNMVNIQDTTIGQELRSFQPGHVEKSQDVKFDLEPYISEYKNGIHIYWAFRKSLFTPKSIEYMVSEYIKLLDYFASHPNSDYKTYRDRGIKPIFKKRG